MYPATLEKDGVRTCTTFAHHLGHHLVKKCRLIRRNWEQQGAGATSYRNGGKMIGSPLRT